MIDSKILFDYFAKISVVNGYEVSEKYIKGLLVILEEQQVTNTELKKILDIISEMDTYGKPPTLAMYLQARRKLGGGNSNNPEYLAAIEFEKIINLRGKVTARSTRAEMREMGINEITIKILGRLDRDGCCGYQVFLNQYGDASLEDRRYIKRDFVDSWCAIWMQTQQQEIIEQKEQLKLEGISND